MSEVLKAYSHVGSAVTFKLRGVDYTVGPYGEFPPLTSDQLEMLKARGMKLGLLPTTPEQRASVRARVLSESNADDRVTALKRKLATAEAGEQAATRAAEEAAGQQRAAEAARDKAESALRTAQERAAGLQGELDKLVAQVAAGKFAAEQSAELEETKAALKGALAELDQLRGAGDGAVEAKTRMDAETARLQEVEARLTRELEAARAEASETARQAEEGAKQLLAAHEEEQFRLLTRIEELGGLLKANGISVPEEAPEPPTKDEAAKPQQPKKRR